MSNKLYLIYFIYFLLQYKINVYCFNPCNNRNVKFQVRNVKMCSAESPNPYRLNKIIIKKNKIDDKLINLQNMTLSNMTLSNMTLSNTVFFKKLKFYYNNYTYYCLIIK